MVTSQLKIFVSSTIFDMPNERKAAFEALRNVGAIPIMSEYTMEAVSADSVTACLNKVRESDMYILIVGGRYGWQPYGQESITELEYNTALENKLPIIVFNTTYHKEDAQERFFKKVESKYFRKTVQDAFELKDEIEKSVKSEIEKRRERFFNKKESIYTSLVEVQFPKTLFVANLYVDKKEINEYNKEHKRYKKKPTLFDYAVSALHMKDISFPRDWIIDGKSLITFHNLHDSSLPLREIIDTGTIEEIGCNEFYTLSDKNEATFKYLLRRCFETKVYKEKIRWIKTAGLFAFIPIDKDANGNWRVRRISWQKTKKKATRTVVDPKPNLKDRSKISNLKCLAFRVKFEFLDTKWYLNLKPDWIFLWNDLTECTLAFEKVQYLKRVERNAIVFNHFNFILTQLQPSNSNKLFPEMNDYPFLTLGSILKFDFSPVVNDDIWVNLEDSKQREKLTDKEDNVDLFS